MWTMEDLNQNPNANIMSKFNHQNMIKMVNCHHIYLLGIKHAILLTYTTLSMKCVTFFVICGILYMILYLLIEWNYEF
jgi:hypothetical protein